MKTDMRLGRLPIVATAAAVMAMTGVAAGDFDWDFEMMWDVSNDGAGPSTYTANENNSQENGDGSATMANVLNGQGGLWSLDYNMTFADGRPGAAAGGSGGVFITANIVVTNNSNVTQTFTLLTGMGTGVSFDNALVSGSVVGTVTDLTFDDATVSAAPGGSIYTGLIDGGGVQTLLDDPFSQSAGGPLLSSEIGPASFGTPDPVSSGVPLVNQIGILLEFELSAGDSASFTAIFEVVPAPGVFAVFGLAGLTGRRRRRRA